MNEVLGWATILWTIDIHFRIDSNQVLHFHEITQGILYANSLLSIWEYQKKAESNIIGNIGTKQLFIVIILLTFLRWINIWKLFFGTEHSATVHAVPTVMLVSSENNTSMMFEWELPSTIHTQIIMTTQNVFMPSIKPLSSSSSSSSAPKSGQKNWIGMKRYRLLLAVTMKKAASKKKGKFCSQSNFRQIKYQMLKSETLIVSCGKKMLRLEMEKKKSIKNFTIFNSQVNY